MAILGADKPIEFFDSVRRLAPGHPVFLLECSSDGSSVVIKQEKLITASAPLLKHNLKVMKQVSPLTTASRILTAAEVRVLHDCVELWRKRMRVFRAPPQADAFLELRAGLASDRVWYKMPHIEVKDLATSIHALLVKKDRSDLDQFFDALTGRDGFERLGQILAADLYNSNHDRFDWSARVGMTNPITGKKFKCLRNLGNVLLAVKGDISSPVGLDSFDNANLREADISKAFAVLEDEAGPWSGRMLSAAGKAKLKVFLTNVVDDLNSIFATPLRLHERMNRYHLNPTAISRLDKGVQQGADAIRDKLKRMLAKPDANPVLRDRLTAMT